MRMELRPTAPVPILLHQHLQAGDASGVRNYFVNPARSHPGHTFQGGIAIETEGIPKFRRYGGYSAYAEGWALYWRVPGDELGLYGDPYVRFGKTER